MGISLLVDGDHQIHRNIHLPNIRTLKTKRGYPTGVIFGVMNILNNLVVNCFDKPVDQIFFLIGAGHSNWRREVYPAYKEKTSKDQEYWYKPPEGEEFSYNELYKKGRYALEKHLPDLGVRVMSAENHEADDLSYLMAKKLTEQGKECIAVSGDGDWLQLVNDPGIPVYRPMKEELVTEKNFEEKYEIPPEGMVLHLSVLGGHDNIPKVQHRFGEKSSIKMIQEITEYTPEAVRNWASKQSAKTYSKLALDDRIEQLRTNLTLVDFSRIPFPQELEQELEAEMNTPAQFDLKGAEIFIKKYELARFASILGRKEFKVLK